jgi:DNA invertase Pin-like site-specific DNA recombinase
MTRHFAERAALLRDLAWGTAPAWSPGAGDLLLEHYRRLLPFWPEGRAALAPADPALERGVLGALSQEERDRIEEAVDEAWLAARSRGQQLEATTRHLLHLVLAWSLALDQGRLPPEADPAEPLLQLFQQGYQLNYSDAGIEFHYHGGWHTLRVPRRRDIEAVIPR